MRCPFEGRISLWKAVRLRSRLPVGVEIRCILSISSYTIITTLELNEAVIVRTNQLKTLKSYNKLTDKSNRNSREKVTDSQNER